MRRALAIVALVAAPVRALTQAAAPPAAVPLTFEAALEIAQAHNRELRAARLGRAVREGERRAAGQYPNPELSFEAARDTPHETLLLGVPLDLFGRRSRRSELAREELKLSDVDDRAALARLRRELRLSFYGLLAAGEQVDLAQAAADVAGRVRDAASARVEQGAAPRLDLMQAELGLARAQAELALARSARRGALAELNALLDRPAAEPTQVTGDLGEAPPLPDPGRALAQAAAGNPEALGAAREIAIEERRLGLLKSERLPVPVLSLGADFDSPGEFQAGARAGLSLSLPLFSRNQGEIAGATARIAQQQARRDAVRRAVEARVVAALARAEAQRDQVDSFRRTLVPTAVSIEELAEESYRLGRTPVLAVLDAQRSLRDVRSDYLQSCLALQAAVADLEDVLGGPIE
jgi:cobalt-zinc-cadmium efflux system outer membrane protein